MSMGVWKTCGPQYELRGGGVSVTVLIQAKGSQSRQAFVYKVYLFL